ncbi:MAG: hypothetical protein ACON5J_12665 [Rubripirellula sp.]
MPHDPYYQRPTPEPVVSNLGIIVVAVASFVALACLVMLVLGVDLFTSKRQAQLQEKEEVRAAAETPPPTDQSVEHFGYTFKLPVDYAKVSEETSEEGQTVIRYSGEDGCHFIFALLTDPAWDRFTSPPAVYDEAVVPNIQGLDEALGSELLAQRIGVQGMPASLFQFYERETFRGIDFTYLLVAMHRGNKVMMKFGGKYNRYKEDVEFVNMPEHWREYLLTLKPPL